MSPRPSVAPQSPLSPEEISLFHSGDNDFYDSLYRIHTPAILSCLRRFLHRYDDQQDVLQNVWGKIYTRRKQYRGSGPFGAWVFRIAHNSTLSHLRSERRRSAANKDLGQIQLCDSEREPEIDRECENQLQLTGNLRLAKAGISSRHIAVALQPNNIGCSKSLGDFAWHCEGNLAPRSNQDQKIAPEKFFPGQINRSKSAESLLRFPVCSVNPAQEP